MHLVTFDKIFLLNMFQVSVSNQIFEIIGMLGNDNVNDLYLFENILFSDNTTLNLFSFELFSLWILEINLQKGFQTNFKKSILKMALTCF